MTGTLCSRINSLESDVLHEFENDTEEIPTLEVNMEAITETESLVLSTLLYIPQTYGHCLSHR